MDKVYISPEEEKKLFAWRDEHKELVRWYRASLDKVKYILFSPEDKFDPVIITVIDCGNEVNFTITQSRKQLDKFKLSRITLRAAPEVSDSNLQQARQEAISVHASVQALLTARVRRFDEQAKSLKQAVKNSSEGLTKANNSKYKKSMINITNMLKESSENISHTNHKYTLPAKSFEVRGHYRQLKSGKTVWVNSFVKYSHKEKKSKVYRVKL